ncbi:MULTISPECIES: 6-phospho-3-hexuloisomerase [Virgibacillus]|uniref:3-hexulose-6-phosphate isomerase n=2 Tax=Virgibacillus TaxID=84406 RepID=A0A024Q6J7_9BACI|nr:MULTISPECIES: 6-phospho-3-hexuloisomerase [Virgibacillus]EQB38391.1 hypothetical protein M948_07365 [Virgibacillus sp. CM-4]MYL41097.1 6-phospho-3-hexuloisomerase [Virgibacillus massiliensis]GGJ54253.1 6-phospho 3-hexuloisomerase [Virgibacillus kapii]CDQ38099.1 3-hexulose-6-phosphate isomerase [Virgibacillus massiliensis]
MRKTITTIASEVSEVLYRIDANEAITLAEKIQQANRIFVAGTGRSGLISKVFAMRMMHIGFPIYVVGETITPSIEADDLLVILSGSGSTGTLKYFAEKAKAIDAKVALVTTNRESMIGKISDSIIVVPAATKKRLSSEPATIQPLGSQFDQSAHLVLDAVIAYLLERLPEANNHTALNQKHANLE